MFVMKIIALIALNLFLMVYGFLFNLGFSVVQFFAQYKFAELIICPFTLLTCN